MTDFVTRSIGERALGLALHYPLLHAAVVGLDARLSLEFGAGGSTRVLVDATATTGGHHVSISGESREALAERHGVAGKHWTHFQGLSEEHRQIQGFIDLALHDGSHAADVVAADVAWAWPQLRRFGLLLVHDTQHSYVGAEVRAGLERGLALAEARFTATTLPYGFGLTIVRREDGAEIVRPAPAKVGSRHTTDLLPMPWGSP